MRVLLAILAFSPLFLLAFLYGVPLADRVLNRVRARPDAAGAGPPRLRAPLPAADLHCDALLWNRSLVSRSARGHVDLHRLREGGVALQVFSAVTSFPLGANYHRSPPGPDLIALVAIANRWPFAAWLSPPERALGQARALGRAAARSQGRLVVVTRAEDIAGLGPGEGRPTGAILSVEGLHGLRGELSALDRLFTAGFRIFGLVHMTDTDVAGSAHGWRKHGLTALGRRVVARIDSLGGIVDLAHASAATIDDVLALSPARVLVSHTGVHGTCPGPRNLSDDQLKGIAAAGGMVGIGFWSGAVCGANVAAIARAARHAAAVAGSERVALGSDFDGAVRTPFDASGIQALGSALLAEGFTEEETAAVMGGNALRFFARALPRG